MVDDRDRQHRPRTTRELANRAERVAAAAGVEAGTFHFEAQAAVNYMAAAAGCSIPCPHCGADLERDSRRRFDCGNDNCPTAGRHLSWTEALFMKQASVDISPPPLPSGTNRRESDSLRRSDNPFAE